MKVSLMLLLLLLFLCACSPDDPEWLFDVEMCELEGGLATVEQFAAYTEVTCDYPEPEKVPVCYAICKPGGNCPVIDCAYD